MKDKGTRYKKGITTLSIKNVADRKNKVLTLRIDRDEQILGRFDSDEAAKKFCDTMDYFMSGVSNVGNNSNYFDTARGFCDRGILGR